MGAFPFGPARARAVELLKSATPCDASFYCREVDRTVETLFDFMRVVPLAKR